MVLCICELGVEARQSRRETREDEKLEVVLPRRRQIEHRDDRTASEQRVGLATHAGVDVANEDEIISYSQT